MASSRRRRTGPVGEGANLTGSFHPSLWWASVPARRASAGRSVGRLAPGPVGLRCSTAWPSAPSAMPWVGARPSPAGTHAPPTHRPGDASPPRQQPPTPPRHPDQPRSARSRHGSVVLPGLPTRPRPASIRPACPTRRARSRPCGPSQRSFGGSLRLPSAAHRRSDQPRSASTTPARPVRRPAGGLPRRS